MSLSTFHSLLSAVLNISAFAWWIQIMFNYNPIRLD
jgi:hypothetical protein